MSLSSFETSRLVISTSDDYQVSASLFVPSGHKKAGVVINSATAVKQGYYREFAEFLSENGFVVITYDYRGIGESQAVSKADYEKLSMSAWGAKDFSAVLDWACSEYPSLEWHCIGHSVGGQLVGLAPNNDKLTSVYCVAAQSGYWGHWEWRERPKILVSWYLLFPIFSKFWGKIPAFMLGGEPLHANIADEWAGWCRHPDYIVDKQGAPIREYFERLQCKMHFVEITDDKAFAPPRAVNALSSFYQSAPKTHTKISPKDADSKQIGHFGFFRNKYRESLWQLPLKWFLPA